MLSPDEYATFATLLAVILPSDSGPGAAEAGAADHAVARLARLGGADVVALRRLLAAATGQEAAAVAAWASRGDPWFGRLRAWAWEGYLADPGGVGWRRFDAIPRPKAP